MARTSGTDSAQRQSDTEISVKSGRKASTCAFIHPQNLGYNCSRPTLRKR